MRDFLRRLWRIVTWPFRFLWRAITWPFRAAGAVHQFLNSEPASHSLTDIATSLAQDRSAREAFIENVEQFRLHLLRSVAWLFLGVIASASFTHTFSQLLMEPLKTNSQLTSIELTTVEVAESLSVFMRIALLSGVILAFPFIAFEFWLFAAPGLKPPAKKRSLAGIPFATALFVGGVVFSYRILVPTALVAMRLINDYFDYKTQWRPDSYFSFTTGLLLWMGVGFEFPIVIWILTSIGLVKPETLKKQWRLAVVIIAFLAAAITPTVDPVTMSLVMAPLIVLYIISIGLSYLAYRRKKVEENA